MTSAFIPSAWLNPQKFPNQLVFECSTNLFDLVETHRAASYFRQLVTLLEDEYHIVDYHLKVKHNFRRNNQLDVWIYINNAHRTTNPPLTPVCISCEPTHELSMTSLLSEQQYTRAWLDARGRSKLILTPIRHVESLSQLNDENGEMEAFWYDAVELVRREISNLKDYYPTMIVNHGTYRNYPHLHLKINFAHNIWDKIIVPRYQEKVTAIRQLLQDANVVGDCLGEDYFIGTTYQRVHRKKQ